MTLVVPLPAASEDVDAILKHGNELRRKGRDRDALAEFQRAAQINETPRVTAQIALAEQALGLWVEAEAHLSKALGSQRDPWVVKNHAVLDAALGTIKAHIGTLEVWGNPAGAEVLIDGKPAGQLPSVGPVSLAADSVALQVRLPGYVELTRTLAITLGSATREHVDLRRLPPPVARVAVAAVPGSDAPSGTPAPTPEGLRTDGGLDRRASSGGGRTALVLGTAGLTAAALAFGVIEHVAWRTKVHSFATMSCDADLPDRGGPTCGRLYDDGTRARNWAFVAYGVGGAFAATSVILYLTRPDASAASGSQVACAVAPSTTSMSCVLRF